MTAATQADVPEARIALARKLVGEARPSEAEAELATLLAERPDDTDALYVLAVAQRYQGHHAEAAETLDRLCALRPDFGRAWQEVGYNFRERGLTDQAIAAFERATMFDSSLVGSWRALADFHARSGDERRRRLVAAQLDWLASLPRPLLAVANLIGEGKLARADEACRVYLRQNPTDVEGMRLLAQIGVRLNILDDAEYLLESALAFAPDHAAARFEYASVLRKRQKFAAALEQMRILSEKEPDNVAFRRLKANIASSIGDHEQALELYRSILPITPHDEQLHLSCGHVLKTVGRLPEAVEAYREAYRLRPAFGDAFWSLANLKTYRFDEEEVALAEKGEAAPTTGTEDRIHLNFALGKHYADAGNPERAFEHYDRGNALKRAETRYTVEENRAETEQMMEVCTAELFARWQGAGCTAPDPIFIVGMPRAGSTLIEQILASHPMVDGTFELPNIISTAQKLGGRRKVGEPSLYPGILAKLDEAGLTRLGQAYIDDTRIHREGAPFFTDKMPNNFRHVGLISLILPNAKIIDARRHPMSCCFSNFTQLFAEGQEFTYGLDQMGRYYRDYVELMDHWDRVLPGKVHRIHYEAVTSDLETEVRRLLDYCGLPFDEACLAFHQTQRAVRTPSAEQVRQPIYQSGREYWKAYEPWLDPLKDALGDVLTTYPYD